jgi:UDP-2,3-diacylglucosamine hydrolase
VSKIYLASDFHLGVPAKESSAMREQRLVAWLAQAQKDADEIFLVGDVFDFWFEYKHAVPRGYTRLLGKLSEITDSGIPIHWFTGNHDMWIFDYLPSECGITIHRKPVVREWDGKKYYIGHGDGLGPGDYGYKMLKKFFASPICQWLFARLHPNFGIGLAQLSSKKSRAATGQNDKVFLGEENEWLAIYCREMLQKEHFDVFIFGHRHLPIQMKLNDASSYINLGDWLNYYSYAVIENGKVELKYLDIS